MRTVRSVNCSYTHGAHAQTMFEQAPEILIALGANQPSREGAPLKSLENALHRLAEAGVKIESVSRWRRSPAFPPGAGADYVNGAARLTTEMTPDALLTLLHETEAALGRVRGARWTARTCDLDLIAFGARIAPDAETLSAMIGLGPTGAGAAPPPDRMILPHPRMAERAFVLAPLADIAPDWSHPLTGATVAEMLAHLPKAERDAVEIIDD